MTLDQAIEQCLGAYDMRPDITGILARLPREADQPFNEQDIVPLGQYLGLSIIHGFKTQDDIKAQTHPLIVIYDDASVEAVVQNHSNFEPKTAIENVYVFLPPRATSATDTEHLHKGHQLDWFWTPIKSHWKLYSEVLVTSLFANVLMLALPIFTMNVYDRVAVNFAQSTLIVLTVGVAIALIFDFMFKSLRSYVLEIVAAKVGTQYDMNLMERMLAIKPMNMTLSTGEKSNLFRELHGIKDFYATRLMPALVDVPFFLLFIGVMAIISPAVAIVPIIGAVLILIITRGLQIPINRSTDAYFKGLQNKSSTLVQILNGMDTIRMLGATGQQLFNWRNVSAQNLESARKNSFMVTLTTNTCMLITYLVNVFVLVVGVFQVSSGDLTVGGLVACSLLSGRSIAPIINLSGLISRLKQSSDVLSVIDKIYGLPYDDKKQLSLSPKNIEHGSIEFSDVNFAYPNQPRPALQSIKLNIKSSERIGIIGRTGAGKSTLARMILRYLEPVSGGVFIDGYAMDNISPEELHRSIGYVPQDGTFFAGTIRSNLIMGCPNASEDMVQKAVTVSGLNHILQSVGQGLDMEIGEGGRNLSGGQKQALALARALVRDPKIVVFDEPVNGIDNSLEHIIKQNLDTYLTDKTFVMITHRTSLLSLVDRLILMESGQIIADGPRDDVMAKLSGGGA